MQVSHVLALLLASTAGVATATDDSQCMYIYKYIYPYLRTNCKLDLSCQSDLIYDRQVILAFYNQCKAQSRGNECTEGWKDDQHRCFDCVNQWAAQYTAEDFNKVSIYTKNFGEIRFPAWVENGKPTILCVKPTPRK